MRKLFNIFLSACFAFVLLSGLTPPVSAGGVDITDKFTDANFRAAVYEIIKKAPGSPIYSTDVANLWGIDVSDKRIRDLAGIEYFTDLRLLSCRGNFLTSLDVSKNKALESLYCSGNKLTSLNISENQALSSLSCYKNLLTTLNIKSPKLTALLCWSNELTSLDIRESTKLKQLICMDNRLNSLDISENTDLRGLDCSVNQLTSLDVRQNVELQELSCWQNQLTSLDINQNVELRTLSCGQNLLTSLDVSQNVQLRILSCSNNQLASLDVRQNTALEELICFSNYMFSEPLGIEQLHLTDYSYAPPTDISTQIPDENFKAAICQILGKEPGAPFCWAELGNITTMDISGCGIKSLSGIEYFTSLVYLDCSDNLLASLDVSQNKALAYLDCTGNRLLLQPNGVKRLNLTTYVFSPQKGVWIWFFLLIPVAAIAMVINWSIRKTRATQMPIRNAGLHGAGTAFGVPARYPYMVYCIYCGAEIDANARFCEKCGGAQ